MRDMLFTMQIKIVKAEKHYKLDNGGLTVEELNEKQKLINFHIQEYLSNMLEVDIDNIEVKSNYFEINKGVKKYVKYND